MEIVFIGNWTSSDDIPTLFTETGVLSKLFVVVNFFDPHQNSQILFEADGRDSITESPEVLQYLFKYNITQIPWRVVINSDKQITKSEEIHPVSPAALTLPISEIFTKGIQESNDSNFCNAMKYFEIVVKNEPTNRDALFNIASLFHMHDYPLLSLPYVEKVHLLLFLPSLIARVLVALTS
jgi:hypothetical protein